jgi:hypothetical protein
MRQRLSVFFSAKDGWQGLRHLLTLQKKERAANAQRRSALPTSGILLYEQSTPRHKDL